MKVVLTNPVDAGTCTWCEKDNRQCVTATFSDRFLVDAPLCWKCLQTSMKVRAKQKSTDDAAATKPANRQAETPAKE